MYDDIIVKADSNDNIYREMLNRGYSKNQSAIMATKITDIDEIESFLDGRLSMLPDLNILTDMDKGSELVYNNIKNNKHIAIVTDYDSDGVNSAVVLFRSLINVFNVNKENITVIINKRENGNGISEKLLNTILDEDAKNKIDLIITADHGSANGISIEKLHENNIDVIVTDHHLVPRENSAINADAFVNPQRDDNSPYRFISGCAVAYLLMVNIRNLYRNEFKDIDKELYKLLPMVAVSTIGDSMALNDPINRVLVNTGINSMNSLIDHTWQAVKYLLDVSTMIDTETIGFNIVPAINAASRMGNPYAAFEFYTAEDYRDSVMKFEKLLEINNDRKKLQKFLIKTAMLQCIDIEKDSAITLVLTRGFGLNGIVSSNIGENFYKPIVTFIHSDGVYHGSGRGINKNFDLHKAFSNIESKDKDIFISWGGHKQAAGCNVREGKINDFKRLFNIEAKEQLSGYNNAKRHEVIGMLDHSLINESIVSDIEALKPFGIKFSKVKYVGIFTIDKITYIGRDAEHVIIKLRSDTDEILSSFIFNSKEKFDHDLLIHGNRIKVVYRPVLNTFRGNIEFRLDIEYLTSA